MGRVSVSLDLDLVRPYLEEKLGNPPGFSLLRLEGLAGGWSRQTYMVEYEAEAESGPVSRRVIVRVMPQAGLLATDIRREYEVMRAAHEHHIKVPRPLWLDEEPSVFEGPSFAVEWAEGTAPNTWRPRDRIALEADWNGEGRLAEQFVESLAQLHSIPRDDLGSLGPQQGLSELIAHWRGTYEDVRIARDPIIEEGLACIGESAAGVPYEPVLNHGDFRIGNMLVQDSNISAILDWELAFVGDPHFDLGYCSLEYLAGRLFRPGSELLCGICEHEWFYNRYEELTGTSVDRELVRIYSALSAIVLIVILLTGVRAYHDGRSSDIRYAWGRYAIAALRLSVAELFGWSPRVTQSSGALSADTPRQHRASPH